MSNLRLVMFRYKIHYGGERTPVLNIHLMVFPKYTIMIGKSSLVTKKEWIYTTIHWNMR